LIFAGLASLTALSITGITVIATGTASVLQSCIRNVPPSLPTACP
jgi:predicted benzoate:H+ symporter BenE